MDPIERIDIRSDSTFALALEAQARGAALFYYLPHQLSLDADRILARARPLNVRNAVGDHFTLGDERVLNLADVDVVLMRQDPPFDMNYITLTHILERLQGMTLVVNDPAEVRNAPEKILVTKFHELTPPTLISNDRAALRAFREKHGEIILKPLYGNGGLGVVHLRADDENFNALLELFGQMGREPVIAQAYLPAVREGDKRIILVDGVAVGAINRVPSIGEARSNLHVGGRPEKTSLTPREVEICSAIGPELKRRGLIFAGIDVIGGYLTEINVTSPTGIWEIRRFDGTDIAALIWDAIEARLNAI
jgi:glutathione synthase